MPKRGSKIKKKLDSPQNYFKSAPMSLEAFKKAWNSQNPLDWNKILMNKVYFPTDFLEDLDSKLDYHQVTTYSMAWARRAFLSLVLSYSFLPERYLKRIVVDFPFTILGNDKAPTEWLNYVFTEESSNAHTRRLSACSHPNVSIEKVVEFIVPLLSSDSSLLYKQNLSDEKLEAICNAYLVNLGWELNTLEALPLRMKIAAID